MFQDLFRVRENVRTGVIALGGVKPAESVYSLGSKLSLDQDVDA